MTGFDLSTIQNCYIGGAAASAIYLGSTKIWPTTPHDYSQDYLTIVSLANNNNIYFGTLSSSYLKTISVSTDEGNTWTNYTSSLGRGQLLATLNQGDELLIKGNNSSYAEDDPDDMYAHTHFNASQQCNIQGNIMSLIYGDNFIGQTALTDPDTFYMLFGSVSNIVNAQNLILPATTLTKGCYRALFYGCSSLITAPTVLPATTLTDSCYDNMFNGCTSLTTAPELPATRLAEWCYYGLFRDCSSLNYIKCLAGNNITTQNYLTYWVDGVAASGTFVKDANVTWWPTADAPEYVGIPSNWTVVDAA